MSGHIDLCTGKKPRCEIDTETCVACVDDNDCGGTGVCLPTGGCADPAKIIHAISNNGSQSMTTCGGLGVGNACDLDTAIAVARSGLGKSVIKLDDPGPYVSMMSNNFNADVDAALGLTIDARNATLHHNGNGAIFTINSGKGMTILGGTIEGATGSGGDGIRCNDTATLTVDETTIRMNNESGIDASGCLLTVNNASILDNNKGGGLVPGIVVSDGSISISRSQIASNRGGGIIINNSGKFTIVGNVFLGNGDPTGIAGGFSATTTSSGNRLEFNTFAENKSMAGLGAGVQCTAAGFIAQNNIVWNNNSATGMQVGGTCPHAFSDIGPISIISVPPFDGGNNLSMNPMFMSATTDLRLNPLTPVRGKANADADLTDIASKDIAGKIRVKPADLGAYVAPPS
jgi:hypothetical protein